MRVYMVWESFPYEGEVLIAAFKNGEDADLKCEKLNAEKRWSATRVKRDGYKFYVTEEEVIE